jgi:hypothetical protein
MAARSAIQPIGWRFDGKSAIKPLAVISAPDGGLILDVDAARVA